MNKRILYIIIVWTAVSALCFNSCSAAKKAKALQKENISAALTLPEEKPLSIGPVSFDHEEKDTLVVEGEDGEQIYIMKAVRDEDSGEMVATDVIEAARVAARFRNVAERHGMVDLKFQIIVPKSMQDKAWQLRFYPDMFALGDSTRLDPVIITGSDYRKGQLRGYERYNNWLSTIVSDTTRFINQAQLELFLERNLPEFYAMRSDSSFVSDEHFAGVFGVTQREAVEHYTNKIARSINNARKASKDKRFRRYVKVPIETLGIRLDTVMMASNDDFVYEYTQTIATRPLLKKVDIELSGEVFQQDKRIYSVPRSEPLSFYISSLSSFVDRTERYLTKVISRRVAVEMSFDVAFASASHEVDLSLGGNAAEIARIKENIASLIENETFDLDSIIVTSYASPEGSFKYNEALSGRRSRSISQYMEAYMDHLLDSLNASVASFHVDMASETLAQTSEDMDQTQQTISHAAPYSRVDFVSRSAGENWDGLDAAVALDSLMDSQDWTRAYRKARKIKDPDRREQSMKSAPYYAYMRQSLYPALRKVNFDFRLHRKGMVKDTVHTTILDSLYMSGVQAIEDRDYLRAIEILRPYGGYNLAIAYVAMDRNASAMAILESIKGEECTAQVDYMKAILHARKGNDRMAVKYYLASCGKNPSYVHRGNLDPEISALIQKYDLNRDDGDLTL